MPVETLETSGKRKIPAPPVKAITAKRKAPPPAPFWNSPEYKQVVVQSRQDKAKRELEEKVKAAAPPPPPDTPQLGQRQHLNLDEQRITNNPADPPLSVDPRTGNTTLEATGVPAVHQPKYEIGTVLGTGATVGDLWKAMGVWLRRSMGGHEAPPVQSIYEGGTAFDTGAPNSTFQQSPIKPEDGPAHTLYNPTTGAPVRVSTKPDDLGNYLASLTSEPIQTRAADSPAVQTVALFAAATWAGLKAITAWTVQGLRFAGKGLGELLYGKGYNAAADAQFQASVDATVAEAVGYANMLGESLGRLFDRPAPSNPVQAARRELIELRSAPNVTLPWNPEAGQARQEELAAKVAEYEALRRSYIGQADTLRVDAYATLQQMQASGEAITEEQMQAVVEQVSQAQEYDRWVADADPSFSYTWVADPERQAQFYRDLAIYEIQLGRPLTKFEIMDLRITYEDPNVQLPAEMVLDVTNLLFTAGASEVLLKPIVNVVKGIGAELRAGIEALPLVGDAMRFFSKPALVSTSYRVRDAAFGIFSRVASVSDNTATIVRRLDEYAGVLGRRAELGFDELFTQLKRIDPSMTETQARSLLRMADTINPLNANGDAVWGKVFEDVRERVAAAAREQATRIVNNLPGLTQDQKNLRIAQLTAQIANDGTHLTNEFSRYFMGASRRLAAVKWSKVVTADSLLGETVAAISRRVPNFERSLGVTAIGKLTEVFDYARTVWINFTLGLRPAWFVNNYFDSQARYVLYGGDLSSDLDVVMRPYARGEWAWPTGVTSTFTSEFIDPNSTGFKSLMGSGGRALRNWRDMVDMFKKPWNLIKEANSQLEFSLRLRMFDKERRRVLAQLGPAAFDRLIETVPEQYRSLVRGVWDSSRYSPARLAGIVNSMGVRQAEGRIVFSHLIPDEMFDTAFFQAADNPSLVAAPFEDANYQFIKKFADEGRRPTQAEIEAFWDGSIADVRKYVEERAAATESALHAEMGLADAHPNIQSNLDITKPLSAEEVAEAQEAAAQTVARQQAAAATADAQTARVIDAEQQITTAYDNFPSVRQAAERRTAAMREMFSQFEAAGNATAVQRGAELSRRASEIRSWLWDTLYHSKPKANRFASNYYEQVMATIERFESRLAAYIPTFQVESLASTDPLVRFIDLPEEVTGVKIVRDARGGIIEIRQSLPSIGSLPTENVYINRQTINDFTRNLLHETPPPKVSIADFVASMSPEQLEDSGELWRAYAQSSDLQKLYGTKRTSTLDSFVGYLKKQIAEAEKNGNVYMAREWQRRIDEAQQAMNAMLSARYADVLPLSAPPLSWKDAPPNVATWLGNQRQMGGDFARILDGLETWKQGQVRMLNEGTLFTEALAPEASAAIQQWYEQARPLLEQILDVADNGGRSDLLPGALFEGAAPRTNAVMNDYTNFSRFTQTMQSVVPFWKFPAHAVPFWLETFALHPQILSAYGKYMRQSERYAYQYGLITTSGKPLPSTAGYVPLFEGGPWVNVLAPLSFRYAVPYQLEGYDDTNIDESPVETVVRTLYEGGRERGLYVGPWVNFLLYAGPLSEESTARGGVLPQFSLVPPWAPRALQEWTARYVAPTTGDWILGNATSDFSYDIFGLGTNERGEWMLEPSPPWQDYLIENYMMERALERWDDPSLTQEERIRQAAEIEKALRTADRESNDLWLEARAAVEQQDTYQTWVQYFSGFYPKVFTSGRADLIAIRSRNNLLRDTLNSQVGASIFGLDPYIESRHDAFDNARFDTPEGMLAQLYNTVRYVVNDQGEPVFGQNRRDEIAGDLIEQEQARNFFNGLKRINMVRDVALRELPIGSPPSASDAIWDEWGKGLAILEEHFPLAPRPWLQGLKSPATVQQHYADIWFGLLEQGRPLYDSGNESYTEFQARQEKWIAEMPRRVPLILQLFKTHYLDLDDQAPTPDIVKQMMGMTNPQGYLDWKRSRDTALDAVNEAWTALRWDPYWAAVEGKSQYARAEAEQEFLRTHPDLTTEQIYDWVVQNYGGRFSLEDVKMAVEGREQLSPIERTQTADQVKYGDMAPLRDTVWGILRNAGPGGLSDLFSAYPGDDGDIDTWYNTDGNPLAWGDPAKFQQFVENLQQAARSLNLGAPTPAQLRNWAMAEELNEQFKDIAAQRLPGIFEILDAYNPLSSSQRRDWVKAHPDENLLRLQYYELKDDYATANPLWGQFYWPQTGGSSSGGGGGRSSSSSSNQGGHWMAPRELYGLSSGDKEKLEDYYNGSGHLTDNFRARLNKIWVELGKPGGSLNNWIHGALKRRFRQGKPKKGKGGGGGSSGGGGSQQGGGTNGKLRLGRRSTLDAGRLLNDDQLGKGGSAPAPK